MLFSSLAADQRERAITVVLSGTGSNGTEGLRDIRAEGGMCLVQSPETAKFDGMPRSAISADLADHVLAPEKMPETLLAFISHGYVAAPAEIEATSPDGKVTLTNGPFVWALVAVYFVANILMFLIMTMSVRWIARLMHINKAYLLPAIFVACAVGSYALHNRMFDVWVMLFFGGVGFALNRCKVPLGPFVIGFVLAGILEEELRSGMQLTAEGFWHILNRPIALGFIAVSALTLVWPLAQAALASRRNTKEPVS